MLPKSFPSQDEKVPSVYESAENPTTSQEHVRRNLVDLAKRLDEAETFLSASRTYLAASALRLDIVRNNMCVSEVDIRTATDCVAQTEKRLQSMHSQLHSLYQSIFYKHSGCGSQDNESDANSAEIHATGAIPMYAADVLGRYADDMSIDLNKYTAKYYDYNSSTYVILQPVCTPPRIQTDAVRHTDNDFRSCRGRVSERQSTFNAENASSKNSETSSKSSENVDQRYEEPEHQCENPEEEKLAFHVKRTTRNVAYINTLKEAVREIYPTDHALLSFGLETPPPRTDSMTPEISDASSASQSYESCEDFRRRSSSFSTEPKLSEEDLYIQTSFNSSSTSNSNSEQNDSYFRTLKEFFETPISKTNDFNRRFSRQVSGHLCKETQTKHLSNQDFFYETKENRVAEEDAGNTSQITAALSGSHSDNSFLSKNPETRLKEIYQHSIQNAAESRAILVNRNRPNSYKKKGGNPSTLTKFRRTCKVGRRKDPSSSPEDQSNRFVDEIASSINSGATPLSASQRTDEYIDNLIHTFEIDTKANNSVLSASSGTSLSDTIPNFWRQDNQPENESQPSKDQLKESRFKCLQSESTTAKSFRKNSVAISGNSTRKCVLPKMGRNSSNDRRYSPCKVSPNRFPSDPSLGSTKASDNKDFETSQFDISGNSASLDSNMELDSSCNRPIYFRNISSSTNIALRFIDEHKLDSPNKIKTPKGNRPVKLREIKEMKNSHVSNSVSNETISCMQSGDRNSCIVHQSNSDSVFQKASNNSCEPNDSCSEPSKSHFSSRQSFLCDTIVLESGFPESYSALNSSGIVDAGSECIKTSNLLYEIELDSKDENYGSFSESVSSEAGRSKRSLNNLSSFCMDMPSSAASSRYSRLVSTETGSTWELSGISSTPFDSQNETTKLLSGSSSRISSPVTSAGCSPKSNFEDPQEECVRVSTPVLPYFYPSPNSSSSSSDSENCSLENSL